MSGQREVGVGFRGVAGRVTQRERQQTFFLDIVFPSPRSSPNREQGEVVVVRGAGGAATTVVG